jgi:hypothetical protein
MIGREAEGHCRVEGVERLTSGGRTRLPSRGVAVPPGQAGAQARDAEILQPAHRVIQPVIMEVEPLHQAHVGACAA